MKLFGFTIIRTRKLEILRTRLKWVIKWNNDFIYRNVCLRCELEQQTIEKEELIGKACEWLKENLYSSKPPYQLIDDFCKAMKENYEKDN